MGGTNSGRSHEPQRCGGAHLPNTLSSPNAAPGGGIGGLPEHRLPDDPHPKKAPYPAQPYRLPAPQQLPPHQNGKSSAYGVRGSRGAEPPGRFSAAAAGRRRSRGNPRGAGEKGALQNTPRKKGEARTPKGYPNLVFSLKIEVCKKLIKSKTSIKYLSDTVNWFLR